MIRSKPSTAEYRDAWERVFGATADASDIRTLRGRIEWRHPQDGPHVPPTLGTCYADSVASDEWYVVWSDDSRTPLGGVCWSTDLACFTPLDDNARKILEWVSPRRNPRCFPSSPWGATPAP